MTHRSKPRLVLEQQALGERPVVDERDVGALREENRRILAEHVPDRVLREVQRRAALPRPPQAPPRSASRLLMWLPVPAVAAALLVFFWPRPTGPDDTFKGDPAVTVSRGSQILSDGDVVAAGDVVDISLAPAGAAHLVLVSVDGGGHVTLHHPTLASSSTAAPRGSFSLDGFRLDDAPAFERFVLVSSSAPIDVAAVMQAARAVAVGPAPTTTPLPLSSSAVQRSVVLRK